MMGCCMNAVAPSSPPPPPPTPLSIALALALGPPSVPGSTKDLHRGTADNPVPPALLRHSESSIGEA